MFPELSEMQFPHLWIRMNSMMAMKMCLPDPYYRKHTRLRVQLFCFETHDYICIEAVLPWTTCIQWMNVIWSGTRSCFRLSGDSSPANLGLSTPQLPCQTFLKLLGTLGNFHPTFSPFSSLRIILSLQSFGSLPLLGPLSINHVFLFSAF